VVGEEEDRATVVDVAPDDGADTGTVVVPAAAATTVVVVVAPDDTATVVVVAVAVLIVIWVAPALTDGPVLELASTTVFDNSSSRTVPSEPHATDTVIEVDVDAADGVTTHPVAVPSTRKSPDAIPDTASLKVSV